MKKTIVLIYGGEGREHNISVLSAKNLLGMIDAERYEVLSVYITENGEWFIEEGTNKTPTFPVFLEGKSGFIIGGKIKECSLALPILHGEMGEDGVVAGLLKSAHIKAIGCPTLPCAVTSDKITAKFISESLGIPTARWIFADCESCESALKKAETKLSYPMFIKPSSLGSSIGISRVLGRNEFKEAYEKAALLCDRILVEEEIRIERELECAYLSQKDKHLYAVGEICLDGQFYDFERKYEKETKTSAFSGEASVTKRICEYSDKLREAIGIRGISRFDFFLSEDGKIYFNEINALPGMTKTSLYPTLTEKMGFSRGEFINLLIAEALI